MTYKNKLITSMMGIFLALSIGVMLSYHAKQAPLIKHTTLKPDAFMENISALVLDKQGKPRMRIVSPKMVHYPKNDTTLLDQPELTLYRQSPQPWHVSARYAKATQGIEVLNFWEKVIIHRAADKNNPATLIKTASLIVHPNQQTAETADPITLIQPNTVIRATGMFADMNLGNIKLLSEARGEYATT